jgi:hypothetical protein
LIGGLCGGAEAVVSVGASGCAGGDRGAVGGGCVGAVVGG